MAKLLDSIGSPEDIKQFHIAQLEQLAEEIRQFILQSVSSCGGHLASNLGVVELTLAIHKVFSSPQDKIVWDVGHQSYVHKILTGRKDRFDTLRQFGGLSGFPKRSESEHDAFNTGHASTSISAALGIAEANRLNGKPDFTIAVIGDGALTGGLAYEGLNNAGRADDRLIVILNDNEMSISDNVGSLTNYLNILRTDPAYFRFKYRVERVLKAIPLVGKRFAEALHSTKRGIRSMFLPGTIFEELGFTYIGPVDGHDIALLTQVLERAKHIHMPVFVHVLTKKGKGYAFAEQSPDLYHGLGAFDIQQAVKHNRQLTYSRVFGQKLAALGGKNEDIVAISAAMTEATGLDLFQKLYPERFYDVGISEGHAVTFAGGLAASGKIPVIAIYSTFLQRAYDNILHDLALPKLHAVLCIDRAGLVGEDGETHHGVFDISYLSHIPGITIFTPSTAQELECALETAVKGEGLFAVRYPKGAAPNGAPLTDPYAPVQLREGADVTVVTCGRMTAVAKNASFDGDHLHLNCIKPIETAAIKASLIRTGRLITAEDNMLAGGMGEALVRQLHKEGFDSFSYQNLGVDDCFVSHGKVSELLHLLKLDEAGLESAIRAFSEQERRA